MKKIWKGIALFLKLVFGFLAIYLSVAFVLSRITVNSNRQDISEGVAIYIKSNGVHTDIVVPIKNEVKDWSRQIRIENTIVKDTSAQFIGIGWGDRDFYLNTPRWSDLKAATAMKAAFYMGTSIMHTTFITEMNENEDCVKIVISQNEYKKLVLYIDNDFQYDRYGKVILIPNVSYGSYDSFYESNGKYSLFYTCNSWTNNGLKAAGLKSALWSLTDKGILCHYR